MALVKPNFGSFDKSDVEWTSGRVAAKLIEIKESDKTDREGNNALIFKFEVFKAANTGLVGKRLSRWYSLGGAGAKSLWRCLKTMNPGYTGQEFDTAHYIGKKIEMDIDTSPDKDGKIWPRIQRIYPYVDQNSVTPTLKGNVMDTVGLVDDFDV